MLTYIHIINIYLCTSYRYIIYTCQTFANVQLHILLTGNAIHKPCGLHSLSHECLCKYTILTTDILLSCFSLATDDG